MVISKNKFPHTNMVTLAIFFYQKKNPFVSVSLASFCHRVEQKISKTKTLNTMGGFFFILKIFKPKKYIPMILELMYFG
jgi:hypothetical protein